MSKTSNYLERIICPHCWHTIDIADLLWIAEADDLMGDSRFGNNAMNEKQRFLPCEYDINGNAVDARGFSCQKMACPNCHLVIPRTMTEAKSFQISIVGGPGSGKSYFLAAMINRLRRSFPKYFNMSITDSDTEMNQRLLDYENTHFHNIYQDNFVKIEKT